MSYYEFFLANYCFNTLIRIFYLERRNYKNHLLEKELSCGMNSLMAEIKHLEERLLKNIHIVNSTPRKVILFGVLVQHFENLGRLE